MINDQTLVGSDGSNSSGGFRQGNQNPNLQVDNAAINYHVCYLKPTEQKLMDVKDIEGLNLHVKKFDVDEMQIGGNWDMMVVVFVIWYEVQWWGQKYSIGSI